MNVTCGHSTSEWIRYSGVQAGCWSVAVKKIPENDRAWSWATVGNESRFPLELGHNLRPFRAGIPGANEKSHPCIMPSAFIIPSYQIANPLFIN